MATKKIVKSKATSTKSKTSRVAPVKKTVAKTAAKGKPASAKSRPASKSSPAGKAKKSTPVAKAKTASKATSKPASKSVKPAAKKSAPAKAPVKAKTSSPAKTTSKAVKKVVKTQPKAAVKPVVKAKSVPVKATLKPVTVKAAAPKQAAKTAAPVKTVAKPVAKTPVPTPKTVAPVKTEQKVKPAEKPVAPKTQPKQPVAVNSPITKSTGSKSSDLATKPKSALEKPKETTKESVKPAKPTPVHTAKTFEKMSDKKEHKPVSATASAEEPHKTRYNDKELEEFDQLIDQKLIVAREQLEFYLKQLEDMAENPDNKIKGLDDGLSTLESERVSSMAARQQKLIQHLENAKIRIKNKVYGICRETGKLISKERLRAVPHATLSIEAKQAQN